jgi:DNA polymerase-1
MTHRLLAIDGNSLAHRAFHSTRHDPDAGPRAMTGSVLSMIATAWIHGPYDAVVVGFDHPVNRRKVEYPEYKANRDAADPLLRHGLDLLRGDLAACGFLIVEEHGVEADDLLASAADACLERGWACDILSSDRDLTALVTAAGVRLLRPRATFADLAVEDEAAVRATYGIAPEQYTDFAALRGDPSDGLKGATGIGPQIAARLLRDYGSVHGLYDALIGLPPKVEAALRTGRDRVERNLVLMAPIPHLQVDVDAAVGSGIDLDCIEAAMATHGLDHVARRFRRAVTEPPQPRPPAPTEEPADTGPLRAASERLGEVPDAGEQAALF